jgi:hypothetical protein
MINIHAVRVMGRIHKFDGLWLRGDGEFASNAQRVTAGRVAMYVAVGGAGQSLTIRQHSY